VGIATVTLLIAYGGSFREILVSGFNAFGKVPSSAGAANQRATRWPACRQEVVLEQADVEMIKETANYVRHACLETWRRRHSLWRPHGRTAPSRRVPGIWRHAQRATIRGRWINSLDELNVAA